MYDRWYYDEMKISTDDGWIDLLVGMSDERSSMNDANDWYDELNDANDYESAIENDFANETDLLELFYIINDEFWLFLPYLDYCYWLHYAFLIDYC